MEALASLTRTSPARPAAAPTKPTPLPNADRQTSNLLAARRFYGVLTAAFLLLGLCLFLMFAYHAFGGIGVALSASVVGGGAWALVKFVLLC